MKLQAKHPVEVKGSMSPKGADRVGMLMAIATVIDKLLWKAIILVILVGLVLGGVYTYRISLSWGTASENQVEISHLCHDSYHLHDRSVEVMPLIPKHNESSLK